LAGRLPTLIPARTKYALVLVILKERYPSGRQAP